MKKFTPILTLIIIIVVVSLSGCIHYVQTTDNQTVTDDLLNDTSNTVKITPNEKNNTTENMKTEEINKVNKSGNIKTRNQAQSNALKDSRKNNANTNLPKISKKDIEKEIVRIMKQNNPYLNFTANATLTYIEEKPVYIVDVYDDYGWCAYFEVDGDNGPNGNDNDGYSFL